MLQDLPCDDDTRAYIVSIFSKYKNADLDLSKDNITLAYAQACFNQDFLIFQTIGDWLFYTNALYPAALKNASKNYYYDIGRLSYYSCYKLINRQWKLYEIMSDLFIPLSEQTRKTFNKII